MVYFLAFATIVMMAYMAWQIVFRLRPERIKYARHATRGKHAFRPKDRMRFLLHQAFGTADDHPEWAEPLVGQLARKADPAGLEP
ncbi:MAG: hypothetical protein H0W74_10510 [Sphingosinicella sp.]|nr:hypothetical protein [Sphingosinicella sp.]